MRAMRAASAVSASAFVRPAFRRLGDSSFIAGFNYHWRIAQCVSDDLELVGDALKRVVKLKVDIVVIELELRVAAVSLDAGEKPINVDEPLSGEHQCR